MIAHNVEVRDNHRLYSVGTIQFLFEPESLTKPGTHQVGQWASEMPSPCLPDAGSQEHHHIQLFLYSEF